MNHADESPLARAIIAATDRKRIPFVLRPDAAPAQLVLPLFGATP